MALNNYSNRPGLLDAEPWSPAGLQAGSGLNRYTNMRPGAIEQPPGSFMGPVMGSAPPQAQQYTPPAALPNFEPLPWFVFWVCVWP